MSKEGPGSLFPSTFCTPCSIIDILFGLQPSSDPLFPSQLENSSPLRYN
jgi:hypothetical protein